MRSNCGIKPERRCRLWKAVYYAKSIAKKPVFQEKAVDLLFIIQHDFIVTINRSRRE